MVGVMSMNDTEVYANRKYRFVDLSPLPSNIQERAPSLAFTAADLIKCCASINYSRYNGHRPPSTSTSYNLPASPHLLRTTRLIATEILCDIEMPYPVRFVALGCVARCGMQDDAIFTSTSTISTSPS